MWKLIETYIKDHRKELDLDEPGTAVWTKIERAIEPPRSLYTKWASYWKVAAIILAVFGAGYWWVVHPNLNGIPSLATKLPALRVLASHPDWEEAEIYYVLEYEKVRKELEAWPWEDFAFSPGYIQRLDILEHSFEAEVKALKKEGPQEAIIQQMILNYEQRIQLLREWKKDIQSYQKATQTPPK